MTGRYLIRPPRESWLDVRQFDAAWHRFVALCRSLDADGLGYDVQFNLACQQPHVLITASGTAKPRKRPAARLITLPPPMQPQRCRERALEAEWFLNGHDGHTAYWRRRQSRYRELSKMAQEHLRAEVDYWRELETISGQRQHFKPGLTDETAYLDDEPAGPACIACAEGHHEQPTQEHCVCPCHGAVPAMQKVAA